MLAVDEGTLLYSNSRRSDGQRGSYSCSMETTEASNLPYDPSVELSTLSLGSQNRQMSPGSAWFNLMNITVGAGCLALPFAFKLMGVVLGVVVVLISGVSAAFTVDLLLISMVVTGEKSYYRMAVRCLGRGWGIVVSVMIVLMCFSCILSYTILIGDLIPEVMKTTGYQSFFIERAFVMGVSSFAIVFPLSLSRSYHFLRYAGMIAITFIAYVIFVVIGWAVDKDFNDIEEGNVNNFPTPSTQVKLADWSVNALFAVPIVCFAFTSHIQAFEIFQELGTNRKGTMMSVVWCAVVSCWVLYLSVSIFGYFTFYNVTDGNLLNNYTDYNNAFIGLGKTGLAIALCCSGPVFVPPIRSSLYAVVGGGEMSKKVYVAITFVIIGAAYGLALGIPNVEDVIALTGCLCSANIMFTLPGLFYISIRKQVADPTSKAARCRLVGAVACTSFGVLLMVAGTATTVADFIGILDIK